MDQTEDHTVVNFFEGKQKILWLFALFLSFAIAVVCWLLAFLLPMNRTVRIVLFIAAVAGTGIFLICIMTAKMRTSKWTADRTGVSYHALGRRLLTLSWEEIKEVGYLKVVDPRRHTTAFYLYWTTEELMSACRNFITGGVMEHSAKYLGKYNRPKGSIILYAMDPYDPAGDPLVTFTQEMYKKPIKNPKVLNLAVEAAKEE